VSAALLIAFFSAAFVVAFLAFRRGVVASRTGNMTANQVRFWSGIVLALGVSMLLVTYFFVTD
jgi:hypothetical protein